MASLASILENYLDKTGTLYVVGKLKELIAGKVDKADGKGLSTNDYTTDEINWQVLLPVHRSMCRPIGMQHLEERLSKISRLPCLPRIRQAHTRQTGRIR